MNKELLHILACPRCHGALELIMDGPTEQGLACRACAVLYPIRDGIPVMLSEEAQPLTCAMPPRADKAPTPCACS